MSEDSDQPAEPTEALIGTILDGRYRLLAIADQDAVFITYNAVHQLMNRPVTVKILRAALSAEECSQSTFQQKVKLLSNLAHAETSKVHDSGLTEDFRIYLVMSPADCDATVSSSLVPMPVKDVTGKKSFWAVILLVVLVGAIAAFSLSESGQLEISKLKLKFEESRLPSNSPRVLSLTVQTAALALRLGRSDDAVNLYKRLCDNARVTAGSKPIEYLQALANYYSARKQLDGLTVGDREFVRSIVEQQLKAADKESTKESRGARLCQICKLAEVALVPVDGVRVKATLRYAGWLNNNFQPEQSERLYQFVLSSLSPEENARAHAACWRGLCLIALAKHDYKQAISSALKLTQLEKNSAEFLLRDYYIDLSLLALAYLEDNQFGEARATLDRLLTTAYLDEAFFIRLVGYREYLLSQKRYGDAIACLQTVRDALVHTRELDRPLLAGVYGELCVVYLARGDVKRNQSDWNEALNNGNTAIAQLSSRDLKTDNVEVLVSRMADVNVLVSEVLSRLERFKEAQLHLARAEQLLMKFAPGDIGRRTNVLYLQGFSNYLQGRSDSYSLAEKQFRQALLLRDGTAFQRAADTMNILFLLGETLRAEGRIESRISRYQEAESLYKRKLELLKSLGLTIADDPAATEYTLAACLSAQAGLLDNDRLQQAEKWKEAERWVAKSLTERRLAFGSFDPRTRQSALYQAWIQVATGRITEMKSSLDPVLNWLLENKKQADSQDLVLLSIIRDGLSSQGQTKLAVALTDAIERLGPQS